MPPEWMNTLFLTMVTLLMVNYFLGLAPHENSGDVEFNGRNIIRRLRARIRGEHHRYHTGPRGAGQGIRRAPLEMRIGENQRRSPFFHNSDEVRRVFGVGGIPGLGSISPSDTRPKWSAKYTRFL